MFDFNSITAAKIVGKMLEVVAQHGGGNYSDWCCGITNDPERRLGEHKAEGTVLHYTSEYAGSEQVARAVEKHLQERGFSGAGGGGTSETVYVYIFKKLIFPLPNSNDCQYFGAMLASNQLKPLATDEPAAHKLLPLEHIGIGMQGTPTPFLSSTPSSPPVSMPLPYGQLGIGESIVSNSISSAAQAFGKPADAAASIPPSSTLPDRLAAFMLLSSELQKITALDDLASSAAQALGEPAAPKRDFFGRDCDSSGD